MSTRAVMIQGTASDAGKSAVVAGLCRAARRRGLRVAPFKPQNMSNNAAAWADGGDIGRAQALQARAAGLAPRTDFNPVLLKPQTDRGSQVVVHGQPVGMLQAADFRAGRARLLSAVMESFAHLVAEFDLVIVEGAGSPAELNLRAGDIANMGFARRAQAGSGAPARGHRSRWRDGRSGGYRRRARGRGPPADRGLPDQQAARRPGAVRGRRAHHRAPHRLALLRGRSVGARGAAPAGRGPACASRSAAALLPERAPPSSRISAPFTPSTPRDPAPGGW